MLFALLDASISRLDELAAPVEQCHPDAVDRFGALVDGALVDRLVRYRGELNAEIRSLTPGEPWCRL